MFSSKTFKVSSHMVTMAYSSINAILLLTMLLSNTSSPVHAAPTGNMEHALYREIVDFSLEFLHDNVTPIFDQYRKQRLMLPTLRLESTKVEGFPNYRDISPTDRVIMSPDDLTITDRQFLTALAIAMQQLEDDERLWPGAEENGFILDFEEINEKLSTLNGFIDRWIALKQLDGTNQLPLAETFTTMISASTEFERSIDAVYILQEMDGFLHQFRVDFTHSFHRPHPSV